MKGETDVKARLCFLGAMLALGKQVDRKFIQERFPVSLATAKRDLVVLENALPLRRDRGVLTWERTHDRMEEWRR